MRNLIVDLLKRLKVIMDFRHLLYAMNLEIINLRGRNMRNYAFYEKTDEHMSKEDLFKLLEKNDRK